MVGNIFNWSAKPSEGEGQQRSPISTPTDLYPTSRSRGSEGSETELGLLVPGGAGTTAAGRRRTPDFSGFNMRPSYEPNPPFLHTPEDEDGPPPLPPPRRAPSPNPLELLRKHSPPKQISLDQPIPQKQPVLRTLSEGAMNVTSTNGHNRDLSPVIPSRPITEPVDAADAPPPLPARTAPPRQHFAPIREDLEDFEYLPATTNTPEGSPPIPKRTNSPKITELKAKFEIPNTSSLQQSSNRDEMGKPALPRRLGERTSPDGRARPLPGEASSVEVVSPPPPPLPAKGSLVVQLQTTVPQLEDLEVR